MRTDSGEGPQTVGGEPTAGMISIVLPLLPRLQRWMNGGNPDFCSMRGGW